MSDRYDRLLDDPAWAALARPKTASVKEVAQNLYELGRGIGEQYKPEIAGALVGAAAAGALGYVANKRWGGKPSQSENDAQDMHRSEMRSQAKSGKPPGYAGKLKSFLTSSNARLSKLMADHPRAAAGTLALTGLGTGARAGRMVANFRHKMNIIAG